VDRPNSAQITLRPAAPADRDAVLELVPRLVEFGPPPWRDAAAMTEADRAVISEAFGRLGSDDPAVVVAERDGTVIGFVHLHSRLDYYRRRPHGHVADLVVAAGAEGLGVARLLLAEAEAWSRRQGYDWLSLAVFERNQRAAALYERYGFGRDALTLVKPLA
jgi:ribosomal protein S18 acetylase RimI-like enzyme